MSRVLLIGWEAADWCLLRPLMEQGRMPHLQKMVAQGASGDLRMTLPRLSASLWTSAVTGKRAHKHRILRSAADPSQSGCGHSGRRCSALWNILDHSGLSSISVGWPFTDPAEFSRGVMVSDRFIRLGVRDPVGVPVSGLQPPRLLGRLSDLVVSSDRLTPGVVRTLLDGDLAPTSWEAPALELARARAAELSTIQTMATALAQWEPWDFMAVHYPVIRFPGPEGLETEFHSGLLDEDAGRLLSSSLACLDRMLGTLVQLVGPQTRTLVVSGGLGRPDPFGFIPSLDALPAMGTQPRERGILAMAGPGIRAGAPIVGASILDVTPTILQAVGVPVGGDMDGTVLPVFEKPPRVTLVPGWDPPVGVPEAGDPAPEIPGFEARIPATGPGMISPEERYHLACDLVDCGRLSDAVRELESSWNNRPTDLRCGLLLMRCRLLLRQHVPARKVFDELLVRLRDADPGDASRRPSDLCPARLDQNALWYLEAELLEREGRLDAAMVVYRRMLQASPTRSRRDLHLRLAEGCLRLGERSDAIQNFVAACSIDATHVPSFVGLSRAYLLSRRVQDAVAESRRSIEMDPSNPSAHFIHGVALMRCGHPDWAAESLEEVVRQSSSFPQAHRRLARIYQRNLRNPARARHHLRLFLEARAGAAPPNRRLPTSDRPAGPRSNRTQGRMAKARTGKPSPPSGLGQATTISAPVGGT